MNLVGLIFAIVVAVGFFVAVVLAVVLVTRSAGRRRHPVPVGQQALTIGHNGTNVLVTLLAIQRGRSQFDYYTELRVAWPDADFRLEIYPEREDVRQRALPGLSALSGDPSAQGLHFAVQSNDVERAEMLLTPDVQNDVNALYRFEGVNDVFVAISGGALVVRKLDPSCGSRDLRPLVQLVGALYEHALTAAEVGMGLHLQATANTLDQATCEICGEAISGDVVYCNRCRTPHHRDCWEYYGACSIYACGETGYSHSTTPVSSLLQPKHIPPPRRHGAL